jgi:hypothetical protein
MLEFHSLDGLRWRLDFGRVINLAYMHTPPEPDACDTVMMIGTGVGAIALRSGRDLAGDDGDTR